MPGPIAAFGTGVDTDALYRRINLLESRSQDPLNVNIGGGTILARSLIRNIATLGRPVRIIPAGDSITQSNSLFTSGLWQYGAGYAESSIVQAGPRFRLIRNAGIAGNTAADLLARLQTDVIAYAPDVCLLMIGTNNFTSGMANSVYTSTFNTVETIVMTLLKAGILPVIVTPPPKNAAATEAKNAQRFYYALAQFYSLPLIDMFRPLVNAQGGAYQASYTADGTHPNAAGIAQMIAAATPVLSNLAGSMCGPYMAAVSETSGNNIANMLSNGSFAYVTTAPTPDNWAVNATNATQTIPAATGVVYTGNTFTYNKTVAGAAYALFGSAASVAGGAFSVGDVLQMNVRMKVSGMAPATASGYQLTLAADSGGFLRTNNWTQNGDMVLSAEMTVPPGTTTLTPQLYVQDVAQYEVNNWTLFNVTKTNAIWQPGQQGI